MFFWTIFHASTPSACEQFCFSDLAALGALQNVVHVESIKTKENSQFSGKYANVALSQKAAGMRMQMQYTLVRRARQIWHRSKTDESPADLNYSAVIIIQQLTPTN